MTGGKVLADFMGPYRVISISAHDRYGVERAIDGPGPMRSPTAADMMKPWVGTAAGDDQIEDEESRTPVGEGDEDEESERDQKRRVRGIGCDRGVPARLGATSSEPAGYRGRCPIQSPECVGVCTTQYHMYVTVGQLAYTPSARA